MLAQSRDRVAKERAMRQRQLKRLWAARLKQLSTMALSREELLMKLGAARDQSVRMAMPMAPPDTLAALGEAGGVMPFATPSSSRPRRPPPELSFSGPHNAVRKSSGTVPTYPCSTSAHLAAGPSSRPCHSAENGGPARAQ